MDIEGLSIEELKAFPPKELDELLAFGRPITFRMGTATILAEFNATGDQLQVNLAHIDGGGEGVLLALWKLIETYAGQRDYQGILWHIHALTCADPNPRLQRFLQARGFKESASEQHGRVLAFHQDLAG